MRRSDEVTEMQLTETGFRTLSGSGGYVELRRIGETQCEAVDGNGDRERHTAGERQVGTVAINRDKLGVWRQEEEHVPGRQVSCLL
jgi:hypothetical protein